MRGFPKHLNSKFDYLYIKDNFPPELWKPAWERLLQGRKQWFDTGIIEEGEGITDDTHKVEAFDNKEGEETRTEWHQFELRDDMSSDFIKFGFTVEEIEAALGEAE